MRASGGTAPKSAEAPTEPAPSRRRAVLVFLACVAVLAVVLPAAHHIQQVVRTRAVVREFAVRGGFPFGVSPREAVARLGGGERAAGRLGAFLSLPSWMIPKGWEEDRPAAAWLLGSCGESAVPALAHALGDADAGVRWLAACELGEIGPAAAGAVPALVESLGDPDAFVRYWAFEALGRIGPAAAGAVPALIEALGDAEVRLGAALALGRVGPAASEAIPELERIAVGNPDEGIRAVAAVALAKIRGSAPSETPRPDGVTDGYYGEERIGSDADILPP